MKVLHLPTSVGGNSWGLAEGERALGLDSRLLVSFSTWLDYPADISLDLQDIPSNIGKFLKLLRTFISIRNKYDVFHFNFGSSLMHFPDRHLNHMELPFYPEKSKLFVTYNGCDARQKYPTMQRTGISPCHNPDCYDSICNSGILEEYKRKGIEKMSRYVKHIWALNPDLLYFLPPDKSSFLPYSVSWEGLDALPYNPGRKLNIVHAPTNRAAKGSEYILAALKGIQQKYADLVDVRIVEHIKHKEALKIYRNADLVIDQILIGWYGGFAVEAMKMGKPVIARIAREDLGFLPREMADDVCETIISAEPDTIDEVLMKCVEDRHFLQRHSQASLEYVHRWHDPKRVAGLTKEKYEE